ncbi:hypothetical protein KZZ08_17655 [Roseovarius mucosus]|uniref:hypothetical protein n=1 Tax=Roseovarius mucosus TaxID=215743 RepID=UPI001C5F7038|nr:hypothetical protein [Roseovarius mucosus]MBW4975461.1 hypothetical protein [Roseovarius mucosus]
MNQRNTLITLATTLAAHRGVTHYAISMRALGKGDFFKRMIERGFDCRTATAERLLAWFDENWDRDLEWPCDIPRPSTKQEDAA